MLAALFAPSIGALLQVLALATGNRIKYAKTKWDWHRAHY
ncbi:hypothetical protein AEST_05100 [Alishewanella aestuarii B11]|uniref:Uncharacterized protein n=1 Tax=Alishewanella aestuarii B11 TaxID=1197174 RepID=J1Q641_9ALTE|nr:hypothetical protein AEST_05100 [Alishewanella aestuarii B11]